MAKKKPAGKKVAKGKPRPKSPPSSARASEPIHDTGPLDASLYVTIAGEATLGLVEYSHAPVTQTVQDFVVHVQDVSARPSDPFLNSDRARDITRKVYQASDYPDMPYLRVIGRVLDELLNHRRYTSCSGGDVYYLLLDELPEELPKAHQQVLSPATPKFDRTLNPGRRTINNRLNDLRGQPRKKTSTPLPALVQTISTTAGGADQGYTLTEDGQWLFDGWPELPELVRGRK